MPPDPARIGDARAWLRIASQDLKRSDLLRAAIPPDFEGALFHCQQAAEKSLKGFLVLNDVPFRRIHDLDELGRQCSSIDPSLAPLLSQAQTLTAYVSRFRYPGARYEPSPEEMETARSLAREVYEAILQRLPEEARP